MFTALVSSVAVPMGLIALGILAVAGVLAPIFVTRRGVDLILAQLRGNHVFQGEIFSKSEWEDGMKAVHDAKRGGKYVDAESWQAYRDHMRGSSRRRRSRV